MRRLLIALLALLALTAVVAACGEDDGSSDGSRGTSDAEEDGSSDLDDVEVSGEPGEEPTVDAPTPFGVDETTRSVLDEGDGRTVADGVIVTVHFVFVNGRDGEVITSSYEGEPADLVFEASLMRGVYQGLDGLPAGSRVLVGIAPEDGLGADPTRGVQEDDTLLMVADVLEVRVPLARAEGEAVPPVAGLPTVELADDGAPAITVPDASPPTELVDQPLIVGGGDAVEAGQTITVHYTGVLWDTGEVFDSSWERDAPATFSIGTGAVIPGWDEGLVGQTVGSQILLVVPPAKGYPEGSPDGSISPDDTIVFVVDILDAR